MPGDKRYKKVYLNTQFEMSGVGPLIDWDTPIGYTMDDKPIFKDRHGRKFIFVEEEQDERSGTGEQSGEADEGSGGSASKIEERT